MFTDRFKSASETHELVSRADTEAEQVQPSLSFLEASDEVLRLFGDDDVLEYYADKYQLTESEMTVLRALGARAVQYHKETDINRFPQLGTPGSSLFRYGETQVDRQLDTQLRLVNHCNRRDIAYLITRLEGISHGKDAMSDEQLSPFFTGYKSVTRCMFALGCKDMNSDKMVGYVLGQTIPNPLGESPLEHLLPDGDVYVQGMGTDAEFRGMGIASHLIDQCTAYAYRPLSEDGRGFEKPIGSTWLSTHPTNWGMTRAVSEVGANNRDPRFSGRSRMIGLSGWDNYFDREPVNGLSTDEGNRIIFKYNPNIFIPDKTAEITPASCIELGDVENALNSRRDKIALHAVEHLKYTTGRPIDLARNDAFEVATGRLLDHGYVIVQTSASNAPIPSRRLFVRIDSFPEETARLLYEERTDIEKMQQRYRQLKAERAALLGREVQLGRERKGYWPGPSREV